MTKRPKAIHPIPKHVEVGYLSELAQHEFGMPRWQAIEVAKLMLDAREAAQGFEREYKFDCQDCKTFLDTDDALEVAREIIQRHVGHTTSLWIHEPYFNPTNVADENDLSVGENVVLLTSWRGGQK